MIRLRGVIVGLTSAFRAIVNAISSANVFCKPKSTVELQSGYRCGNVSSVVVCVLLFHFSVGGVAMIWLERFNFEFTSEILKIADQRQVPTGKPKVSAE